MIKIDPPNGAKATTKLIRNVVSKIDRKKNTEISPEKAPQMGAISQPIGYQSLPRDLHKPLEAPPETTRHL